MSGYHRRQSLISRTIHFGFGFVVLIFFFLPGCLKNIRTGESNDDASYHDDAQVDATKERESVSTPNDETTINTCPDDAPAPSPLPDIAKEELTLAYWLSLQKNLDDTLVSSENIQSLNRKKIDKFNDLSQTLTADDLKTMILDMRILPIEEKFAKGTLTFPDLGQPDKNFWKDVKDNITRHIENAQPHKGILSENAQLHCGPHKRAYIIKNGEERFSRNHCSMAKQQEIIEIFFEYPENLVFARTRYSWGWIDKANLKYLKIDEPLDANAFVALRDVEIVGRQFPKGTFFSARNGEMIVAAENGLKVADENENIVPTSRALTRRSFLTSLFAFFNDDYGWGGHLAGRDCSRLMLDVFEGFGLKLPRHSSDQAKFAHYVIDTENADPEFKLKIADLANQSGLVLLYFPGHIMFYLGRNHEGKATVFHAFSEYLKACDKEKKDTLVHVDKVTISRLDLGKNTARRSFAERITRIVVFADTLHPSLLPMVEAVTQKKDAPYDTCLKDAKYRIFVSPSRIRENNLLRIVALSQYGEALNGLAAKLTGPDEQKIVVPMRFEKAPGAYAVASLIVPKTGNWTIKIGDGDVCYHEKKIKVAKYVAKSTNDNAEEQSFNGWSRYYEELYAIFIKELFLYPPEETPKWNNLRDIFDSDKNILKNYNSEGEDAGINLEPDCADLPYMLRAYFAWKMRLPAMTRKCSRGKSQVAPKCKNEFYFPPSPSGTKIIAKDFVNYARATIANHVHSGTLRTLPTDDLTDTYSIEVNAQNITPGTVYADPDGHVLVVSQFIPQKAAKPGILFAIDAQPDGTITRKRFWRGNFLFSPDIRSVGAGFKAFRPIVRKDNQWHSVTNEELAKQKAFRPFSMQQYEGSVDDFYDAMDEIINPVPMPLLTEMQLLVDALEENALRRVESVQNGVDFLKTHSASEIVMPHGYAIFVTTGPWEDYATPARDMRFLIAMDTVMHFPDKVLRNAERYGIANPDKDIETLKIALDKMLKERTFEYGASDGKKHSISLKDVIDRMEAFEMTYHPADCPEIRWGAPENSEEIKSCAFRAPEADKIRMEKEYRAWFKARKRSNR